MIVSFAILKEKTIKVQKVLDSLGELLTTFINQNSDESRFNSIDVAYTQNKAANLTSARDPNSQTAYKYFQTYSSTNGDSPYRVSSSAK